MNSPVETLQECRRRGITLTPDGDRLTFKAPPGTMTPDLLSAVKRDKAGILEHLSAPECIRRQRWGITPDCEIALTRSRPALCPEDVALLVDHFSRQSEAVREWSLRQAERYAVTFPEWPKQDRGNAALLDVLLWQWERSLDLPTTAPRYSRTRTALKLLESIRDETEHLNAKEAQA
jgi:hypothetical protein